MQYLKIKISPFLLKLFMILFTVLALSACAEKDDDGALVVGEQVVTADGCMGCQILVMIYDAVGYNVGHLHKEFSEAAMSIVMVAFAIWLALRLLKFVSSVSETNPGEVWNEILRKAFICLICGLLASSTQMLQYTLNTIIFPIYLAFLELGSQILQGALTFDASNPAANPPDLHVFGQTIRVRGVEMKCNISGDSSFGSAEAIAFPTSIRNTMQCMINAVSAYLKIGGDIAWKAMRQPTLIIGFIMGFITWCFFEVVRIGFVFYLVDCIFQMGIIILLLPMFIIAYAFGPTKKWTGIGLSKVLASAGFMMCFSVIVAAVVRAMIELITGNPEIYDPQDQQAAFSDISLGFICLLLIGFLVYGSMGVCQQLTSGLIGGKIDANFQKNLKAAIQMGVEVTLSAIGALLSWGSSLAPQSNVALIRNVARVVKKAQQIKKKIDRLAGRSKG